MVVNDVGLHSVFSVKCLFLYVFVWFFVGGDNEGDEIFLHSAYEKKFISLI